MTSYTLNKLKSEISELKAQRDELLEALESCVSYGSMTGDEWVIEKARAAIAKANGERGE